MLQAHTKLCPAHAPTLAIGLEAFTTVSIDIVGSGVMKFLEPDLEHPLRPGVTGACDAQCDHDPYGQQRA